MPNYNGKVREGSFLVRGPKLFNSLPIEVRNFPFNTEISAEQSMNNFKHILNYDLKSIDDKPNLSSNYTQFMSMMSKNGDMTNSIPYPGVNTPCRGKDAIPFIYQTSNVRGKSCYIRWASISK